MIMRKMITINLEISGTNNNYLTDYIIIIFLLEKN